MGIGLAIAGGGLKGVAHIGAIKALEEIGIKIEYISGTSSGSLMAAMYSCGYDFETMKEMINKYYKSLSTFEKTPIVKQIGRYILHKEIDLEGLTNGEKIEKLVSDLAKEKNIENIQDVKIPLAIATCDTITMKECIFTSKDYKLKNDEIDYIYDIPLGKAVRASMSFPGIYTTCNFGKYNFIDGGTKDNLPVQVLKDMGAEKVIAVSFDLEHYTPSNKLTDVVVRALDIFSLDDVVKGRKLADVSCIVKTENTSLLEIKDIDAVVKAGYDAVMEKKDEILKLVN